MAMQKNHLMPVKLMWTLEDFLLDWYVKGKVIQYLENQLIVKPTDCQIIAFRGVWGLTHQYSGGHYWLCTQDLLLALVGGLTRCWESNLGWLHTM